MKFYKIIFTLFIIFLFSGCDFIFPVKNLVKQEKKTVVKKQPKEESSKKRKKAHTVKKCPEVELVNIIRADLFSVFYNGVTQNIHLAGLLAPTTKSSRYNRHLTKKFKFNNSFLGKIGKEGQKFVRNVTEERTSRLKINNAKTNGTGKIIIDGDIIFGNDSSLSEKLLEQGFAVVNPKKGEAFAFFEGIEKDARNNEKGIWKNSINFDKRFRAESDFDFKTVSLRTDKIRSQSTRKTSSGQPSGKSGHVLESHKNFEKQAEISIKIDVQKPMLRTYRGEVRFSFHTRETFGKRQQNISHASPKGTLKRDGTYKPLTSSDKKKKRREDRKVKDYNKKVRGQNIYSDSLSPDNILFFELTSISTNLKYYSDVVEFTESRKAGVNYEQGTRYVGYDLEVWVGDTLLHSHKHE